MDIKKWVFSCVVIDSTGKEGIAMVKVGAIDENKAMAKGLSKINKKYGITEFSTLWAVMEIK